MAGAVVVCAWRSMGLQLCLLGIGIDALSSLYNAEIKVAVGGVWQSLVVYINLACYCVFGLLGFLSVMDSLGVCVLVFQVVQARGTSEAMGGEEFFVS
ncbi:hypothetical protein HPP92_028877 [Vanilla planifolia]|uniref:Uncharacterized protein n=1 Tax=Vanilla planifolia TaxID=51239 RepID=A0A835U1V3_VANPL|nr:hypothetical protein HPP92_028877 [Vanilla planifolia]KAG0446364.1 hypothetical protein HPP92_028866 [Vanilla planifolia]